MLALRLAMTEPWDGLERFPPTPPGIGSEELGGPNPGDLDIPEADRDAMAAQLASRPPLLEPQDVDVEEAFFWERQYLPEGCVLCFRYIMDDDSDGGEVAMMVRTFKSGPQGVLITAKYLGAEKPEVRPRLSTMFRSSKARLHICRTSKGECRESYHPCLHLRTFRWYPVGHFTAPWVSTSGKKALKEAKAAPKDAPTLEGDAALRAAAPKRGATKGDSVEARLDRLRGDLKKGVTFAARPTVLRPSKDVSGAPSLMDGTAGPRGSTSSLQGSSQMVKKESIEIPSDPDERPRKDSRNKVGDALAKAVAARQGRQRKAEERRSRSRSRRSRRRKQRRKKRKRDDSRSESPRRSRSSSRSSSSSSLLPPLKRKSQRKPGSVFKMLEQQAKDQLADDGVLEEHVGIDGKVRTKLYTFYQLVLRPQLDPKSRDCRELSLLARCLDLLQEGKVAELADSLAARLMAVETSTHQGWQTARHLELWTEDTGPVPAHVLLQAQRHGRQVDRAGGKGSWSQNASWSSWASGSGNQKGQGKGKQKGKKGKSKGKGKGSWNDKPAEKDPPDGKGSNP